MSDELIKKNALISTLKNWLSEDKTAHSTMYGDGYDDAVQDIIKLIETEMPVNAVELPCKIGDTVYEPCKFCNAIHEYEVVGFRYKYDMVFIECDKRELTNKDIGERAFFTKEEAERALEDLKKGVKNE